MNSKPLNMMAMMMTYSHFLKGRRKSMTDVVIIEHGILNCDIEIRYATFEYVADFNFPSFFDLIKLLPEQRGKLFPWLRDSSSFQISYGMEKEREDWLKTNMNGDYVVCMNHFNIYFNDIEDAMLYKLKW